MTFSGLPFLLGFLPLVLCGYAFVSRLGEHWAKSWLIVASVLFYADAAPAFLPLLLLSVIGNLLLLHAMHGSAKAAWWATLGVCLNLGVLCWFKGMASMPLGLSFFTFTQIGCLLHHAGGDMTPPRMRDYALFAGFFPALTAGPILNPGEMLPQFSRTRGWRLTADNLAVGSGFFLLGLLKKTVLADPLSGIVSAGFGDPGGLTMLAAWQAACGYSLQLYFDFSGYTDMAIGLGWMFGLRLPDNFDQPYRASSVIAYWQRWHMSLTRFLMANIHTPLTLAVLRWRRRHGLAIDQAAQRRAGGFLVMIALPVAATMTLVSLWHGTGVTFLVFGGLHTAYLLLNHAWRLYRGPALPMVGSVALTYLCVLVASVFFRAASVPDAAAVLAGMMGWHGLDPSYGFYGVVDCLWLAGLYAIVWGMPSTRQLMQPENPVRIAWRRSPQWAAVMGCGATLGLLAAGGSGEFLYFRF